MGEPGSGSETPRPVLLSPPPPAICPDPLIFTGTEITDHALDPAHPQP